ncbi:unnamed protein product, partial [Cochlearia groenlandica]
LVGGFQTLLVPPLSVWSGFARIAGGGAVKSRWVLRIGLRSLLCSVGQRTLDTASLILVVRSSKS